MRAARLALACASLLVILLGAAACGGGGDSTSAATTPVPSSPAPPKSAFPQPQGRSLEELLNGAGTRSELIVAPEASVFYPGPNRYPFSIHERDGQEVPDAEVAVYYARVPTPKPGAKSAAGSKGQAAKAEQKALEEPAVGPFPAKIESLGTKPAFLSQTTAENPDAARVVYSAELPFAGEGSWRMAVLIREGDETSARLLGTANVGEYTRVPRPGEAAPLIHTPTAKEVGGDLAKITTRVPPDTQNAVDYADALGKEPILLLFATPQFCQSRVCGPVVDVAEQAKQEFGDKAAFIHMEIFKDNDPESGVRPQVRRFHLPTEPWLFAINRNGVVSSAVEGGFGLELMDEVAEKVIAE
ncbi:MAG TPA: hypothetical protein VMT37_04405 [Solirubrobacterales bacterium]|nr:hypothetical protein [Solirubrobacterales bacterium]